MASDASASTSALKSASQAVARPASLPTTSPTPSLHSASERSVPLDADPQKIKKKKRLRPKPSEGARTNASASIVGLQMQPQEPVSASTAAVLPQKTPPPASHPKSTVAPPVTVTASHLATSEDLCSRPFPKTLEIEGSLSVSSFCPLLDFEGKTLAASPFLAVGIVGILCLGGRSLLRRLSGILRDDQMLSLESRCTVCHGTNPCYKCHTQTGAGGLTTCYSTPDVASTSLKRGMGTSLCSESILQTT